MLSVKQTSSLKHSSTTKMSEFKRLLALVLESKAHSKKPVRRRSSAFRKEVLSQLCLITMGHTLVVRPVVTKSIYKIYLGEANYVKVFKRPRGTHWWRQTHLKLKHGLLRGSQVRPIYWKHLQGAETSTPNSQRMSTVKR